MAKTRTHFITERRNIHGEEYFACGRHQQMCVLDATHDATHVTCLACLKAMERSPHATCYLCPAS